MRSDCMGSDSTTHIQKAQDEEQQQQQKEPGENNKRCAHTNLIHCIVLA